MHPELFKIPGINFPVPSYGLMVLIAFLSATWWAARRARRVKADPDIILNLALIALVFSTIGARAFYVIHYWDDQFADQPSRILSLSAGGFEIYGGVLGAFLFCLAYLLIKRLPVRLYGDIVIPSLLLGMGIGRIGCFLFGCCWGSTCPAHMPWAVQFPYGSPPFNREWEQRQTTVPDELILVDESGISGPMPRAVLSISIATLEERLEQAEAKLARARSDGDEKKIAAAEKLRDGFKRGLKPLLAHYHRFETTPEALQALSQSNHFHTLPRHPSQLYGAIGPLLLAVLTNAYFYRRRRHGTVMLLGFGLYAVQRFIEEAIRSDNPLDTFGLTVSQGVSVGVLIAVLLAYLVFRQMPEGSPKAKPWSPPPKKGKSKPEPVAGG